MKVKAFASIFTLFLLSFATSQLVTAQTHAASGSYQFSLEDGYTKYAEFAASTREDGSTTGELTLSDEAPFVDQDVDGTGERYEEHPGFFIKAEFDGLVVERNQAVMSGTVRDSSISSFIGQRVLITVEDNGDNTETPDKLTWGIYAPTPGGWEVGDAEWEKDPGVGMTWETWDEEREDREVVEYPRKVEPVGTQSFPFVAYDFVEVQRGAGDIRVEQ